MKRTMMLLSAILVIVGAVYFGNEYFNKDEIEIEIGIYSGNEWGVPQIEVYKIYEEAIALFESEHENVTVVFRSGTIMEDYSEWFAQRVLEGTEPDVFIVLEEDFSTLSEIGMLESLNKYIEDEPADFTADFYGKAIEAGNYQGEQFAMPFEVVPTFMIVNETLLNENHIDMPKDNWTVNEFTDICEMLTQDTDGDNKIDQFGAVGYDWSHAYYAADGNFVDGEKAVDIYDEEKVAKAIDLMKDLYQMNEGYIVNNNDFNQGNVGFKTFSLAEFRAYKPYPYRIKKYSNFEWEAISFPVFEGNQSQSKLYTVQLGMSSRSKEKNMAWEFMKFLSTNEEVQQMVWDYTYALPTKISIVDSIYSDYDSSDDILDPNFLERIIEQSVAEPSFKEFNQIRDIMDDNIKLCVYEDKSTSEAIRILREYNNEILFKPD